MAHNPPKVTEDTCTLCHTPINSPRFDFEKYRRNVGCVLVKTGKQPIELHPEDKAPGTGQ